MEIFWIVTGIALLVIYLINRNKIKTTDKTIIRQKDTYKTDTGEVTIERTKVIDTSQTTFTAPQPVQSSPADIHNQTLANARSQQTKIIEAHTTSAIQTSPKTEPRTGTAMPHVELKSSSEQTKQCTRCRINLPFSKFSKSSKNPDGMTIWCTECLRGDKNTRHMKWCPKCKIRRKRTSFYPNNQNADGLMAWCKTCWDKHKGR